MISLTALLWRARSDKLCYPDPVQGSLCMNKGDKVGILGRRPRSATVRRHCVVMSSGDDGRHSRRIVSRFRGHRIQRGQRRKSDCKERQELALLKGVEYRLFSPVRRPRSFGRKILGLDVDVAANAETIPRVGVKEGKKATSRVPRRPSKLKPDKLGPFLLIIITVEKGKSVLAP